MKAQFAIIEATVSLAIVVSAIVFVSNTINLTNSGFQIQQSGLRRSIAIYDVINLLVRNATANNCLARASETNQSLCLKSFIRNCSAIFGLRYLNIKNTGARSANYTSNSTQSCVQIYVQGANQTKDVCVVATS